MSEDVVKRLRELYQKPISHHPITAGRLLNEAADEIERLRESVSNLREIKDGYYNSMAKYREECETLRADNARLRAALELLVNLKDERDNFGKTLQYEARKVDAWDSARAALNGGRDE